MPSTNTLKMIKIVNFNVKYILPQLGKKKKYIIVDVVDTYPLVIEFFSRNCLGLKGATSSKLILSPWWQPTSND